MYGPVSTLALALPTRPRKRLDLVAGRDTDPLVQVPGRDPLGSRLQHADRADQAAREQERGQQDTAMPSRKTASERAMAA